MHKANIMPRPKVVPNNKANEERGYISRDLTEEERIDAQHWCNTPEELWEQVARLLDSQMQFKVSYDKNNDCYACYISGHWQLNKPDSNWTLTGRGSSWDKAVRRALFIHFELLGGNWSEYKKGATRKQDWD
jgi:hypothetical protein